MEMPKNIYAWRWNIKPEFTQEYVKMHIDAWPEVLEAHSKAGIKNYSIFQNGNEFFYYFETDDFDKAMKYLDNDPVCQRWNSITSKMITTNVDFGDNSPLPLMSHVFYLK
jgi:L-rhamnose mutarotase